MNTAPKFLFVLTAVAALSLAYPASVQAGPTTYQYTGHHFTFVSGPYTTSDFVTAMVMLAGPLGANMPLTQVYPTAFTLSDGVQTISNLTATGGFFYFATNASGAITEWNFYVREEPTTGVIYSFSFRPNGPHLDAGVIGPDGHGGYVFHLPGMWRTLDTVPDVGSTLSLMTLTLMALGLVGRQFKRAAA